MPWWGWLTIAGVLDFAAGVAIGKALDRLGR